MNFDDIIKEKLSGYHAPMEPGAWEAFKQNLGAPAATPFIGPMIGGIAASALILGVMIGATKLQPITADEPQALSSIEASQPAVDEHNNEATIRVTIPNHVPQEVHEIALTPINVSHEATEEPTTSTKEGTAVAAKDNTATTTPAPAEENPEPKASIPSMDFMAKGIQCAGSDITFSAKLDQAATVSWLFDGLTVKDGIQVSHAFDTPGDHEARMTVSTANGETYKLVKTIHIYEQPQAGMLAEVNTSDQCFGASINLNGHPGGNTYKWLLNGDTIGKGMTLDVQANKGVHNVAMLAINEAGCTAIERQQVRVEDAFELYLPQAFSASKADGINDEYAIAGLEDLASFHLKIMRLATGTTVYESNVKGAWDGTINGTVERPQKGEQFLVILVAVDRCGNAKEIQQTVTYF